MTTATKTDIGTRLRRIEGQTRGLQRMVAEDRPCAEILQQVAAVEAALKGVALTVAREHVADCMGEVSSEDERREAADELMVTLDRLLR